MRAQLRHALFQGELKPGDYLGTEAELCDAFGVSRLPVRDALQALKAVGWVEVRAGKFGGIFVAQPDPDRFAEALAAQAQLLGLTREELFDDQELIEGMAAELAAKHATRAEIKELESILDELEDSLRAGEHERVGEMGIAFRLRIAEFSRNRMLQVQVRVLTNLLYDFYTVLAVQREEIGPRVLEHHRKLLKLIESGDVAGIHRHIRRYINGIRKFQQGRATAR
ncbi:MAG: FadR/GntR family transcriptional regulator [Gammaproteobacteria bacterium]